MQIRDKLTIYGQAYTDLYGGVNTGAKGKHRKMRFCERVAE